MTELFDDVQTAPDPDLRNRYATLVGIDDVKDQIETNASLLLRPDSIVDWSRDAYGEVLPAVDDLVNRPPLILLGGDVGSGKTELATTFPDAVARSLSMDLTVFHLGLSSRGRGAVGEMTRRIGAAFKEVSDSARGAAGAIIIVDEADSIAQSRDLDQMHHEDRAGVNAIIRGIDRLASPDIHAVCVMCTNRPNAVDPAVRRRAALELGFGRPSHAQRVAVFTSLLGPALGAREYDKLAGATGEGDRGYGYTFSDIRARIVPAILLASVKAGSVTVDVALAAIERTTPTKPFSA